ncbi:hypothetical protein BLOT_014318, partial [Blomia tropicalis]
INCSCRLDFTESIGLIQPKTYLTISNCELRKVLKQMEFSIEWIFPLSGSSTLLEYIAFY